MKGMYQDWIQGDNLLLVASWARNGLTDQQIAHNIGITPKTLCEWKNKYGEFRDALKKNKEVADSIVENALFIKTQGQYVNVRKPMKVKRINYDPDTGKKISEEEEIVEANELIYIPADTTAQIFWLKNRRPDRWRAKPELEAVETEEAGVIVLPEVMQIEMNEVE